MGSKTTTNSTHTNNHQFLTPPKNDNYEQAKTLIDSIDYSTPVYQAYGQQDNLIKESGNEIFGANTSPEMAQKVRESRLFRSKVDKGRDLSAANQREITDKTNRYMSLGDATKAPLVNAGGTSTGTVSTPASVGSVLGGFAQGASGVAAL